jgi:hypothetical protein
MNIHKLSDCFKSDYEIYGCNNKKIGFMWSPRAGCTITFKCFLDMVGLLKDAEIYNNWLHKYRSDVLLKNIKYLSLPYLKQNNFHIIKTIVNPYSRSVSVWRILGNKSLSFRDFVKDFDSNSFSASDKYHMKPQYIENEHTIVTHYIKLDKFEKVDVMVNTSLFTIDVTKYNSDHHVKREDVNFFMGDIKLKDIKQYPISYKYFYDDEIKQLVYNYYKNDIENYKYTFDEMI